MIATNRRRFFMVTAMLLITPSLSFGSGFALFEHGNRGMAMAGAMTAVADDPSALFWNPAGMAFQTDEGVQLMAGVVLVQIDQTFYGEPLYPGDGYIAELREQTFTPIHLYLGIPVNDRLEVSVSLYNPWGLGTYWDDDFLGRYISTKADIEGWNLGLSMAYQLSENFAFGLGFDFVYSSIQLRRTVGQINPFNQRLTDVADAFLRTSGTGNTSFAWNAGLLWKIGSGFQLGALYRSGYQIDFEGKGSFNQIPTGYPEYDALLGTILPFDSDTPITTSLEYPDFWTLGLSWQNERWTVSGQYGVMGWAVFDELSIVFPEEPQFSQVVREDYENAAQWRIGAELRASQHWALQVGYLFDETGQPIESMSPLLGDGDRTGYCAGVSYLTDSFRLDIGYMRLEFGGRSTEGTAWDGFDGTYDGSGNLAGATFTFKF